MFTIHSIPILMYVCICSTLMYNDKPTISYIKYKLNKILNKITLLNN